MPNPANPQSLNRYTYVLNNPLKYTDPTGHCIEGMDGYDECVRERDEAEALYHIDITGGWTLDEMHTLIEGLTRFAGMFNDPDAVQGVIGGTTIERIRGWSLLNLGGNAASNVPILGRLIYFFDEWAQNVGREADGSLRLLPVGTVVHELAHRWDNERGGQPSSGLVQEINMRQAHCVLFLCWGKYTADPINLVGGSQAQDNPQEAWAHSVAAYAVPDSPKYMPPNSERLDPQIRQFIALQVNRELRRDRVMCRLFVAPG